MFSETLSTRILSQLPESPASLKTVVHQSKSPDSTPIPGTRFSHKLSPIYCLNTKPSFQSAQRPLTPDLLNSSAHSFTPLASCRVHAENTGLSNYNKMRHIKFASSAEDFLYISFHAPRVTANLLRPPTATASCHFCFLKQKSVYVKNKVTQRVGSRKPGWFSS